MLYKTICDYIKFISREYSLLISLHFNAEFSRIFLDDEAKELYYFNNHYNPYCMAVKSNPEGHRKCIEYQKKVLKKCEKHEKFCGICHAGVLELIYTLKYKGTVCGFVSIGGYEGNVKDEHLKSEEIPEDLCDILIFPLCVMIEKMCEEYSPKKETENDRILSYINSNYTHLTLDKLCREFHKSRSSVSHSFKHENGVTLSEYCNRLKLRDAEMLLKTSDLSVTEICFSAGFESLSYFISLFKKKTGMTPLRYKNGGK